MLADMLIYSTRTKPKRRHWSRQVEQPLKLVWRPQVRSSMIGGPNLCTPGLNQTDLGFKSLLENLPGLCHPLFNQNQ